MDVSTAKAIAMLSLGLGSFIAGMLPACISQSSRQKHPLLISCLLCFGGGVLLSTSLVHMLPEAREKYPRYSELVLCAGFFMVYLVDEIVHFFYGANERRHLPSGLADGEMSHRASDRMRSHRSYGIGEETSLLARGLGAGDQEFSQRCCGDVGNPRMCHVSHTEPCNKGASGVIGLLCALFVHSLLEGLAIGLQETASQVLLLFAAVACHKYVVGFCLGAEICASGVGRLCAHLAFITLFSGGSVAGIAIGAGVGSVGNMNDSVVVPIMQALAAGTLLYVTVSEVLPRERARWHGRGRGPGLVQMISVAVGFVLMYLSTAYIDHDAV
ncbi:unnamed protein product [Danaus chrysippus]|uniref:(African queen) hypothetical protein n=1 Tax=Danaus chrysippus TaxID=151541 RepID=A0A8J2QV38_9NEOP|nr:unnamed protein product [Danaus chrysippus]